MDEFLLLSLKIIVEISLEFWMVYSCEVVVASKYGGLTRYKKVVRKKILSRLASICNIKHSSPPAEIIILIGNKFDVCKSPKCKPWYMIIVGPYQMVWRLLCRFCFIKRLITVQPFVQYSVLWYEFGHLQLSNESNEEDCLDNSC
jgi:hypothetical protein